MVQQLVLKNFVYQIGKKIKSCEELPVAPFSSIRVENMPDNIDRIVLSNDQQYLYDICLEISRGEYYSDLALRKPDLVAHSRWMTFAGRILRLYVVTEKPSDNLIILETYIMKVYATFHGQVPCQDKALHNRRRAAYLETFSFSRYLEPNLRNMTLLLNEIASFVILKICYCQCSQITERI
ncbi:hypothetical protein AVEN_156596-1 [Araneus ventricosus]|uniref:Uncharacterized protein n=1 Tax=Araneus ventricosus TaxID=182803 RepID=A0A4Y2ETE3_ARAVE|nr:hypothetical protein AVEN_156596-1 [Araneus ventricosus]